MKTGPERQHRFFKARAIKFQRKLNRLGEKAIEPENFSNLLIEGQALVTFMAADAMSRKGGE
jgi:hypothetical protein